MAWTSPSGTEISPTWGLARRPEARRSPGQRRTRAKNGPGYPELQLAREPLLPQRAFPSDRDRPARLPGEPDADPEVEVACEEDVLAAHLEGQRVRKLVRQRRRLQPQQAADHGAGRR